MPHLNDQTEQRIHIKNFEELKKIASYFRFTEDINSETEVYLRKVSTIVQGINIDLIPDPSNFIEELLYPVICSAGALMKEGGALMGIYQKSVLVILKKIINIFAERTKKSYDLSFISKYLSKKIPALFKRSHSSTFVISFSDSSNQDRTQFYLECVSFITKQCINLVKLVWHLSIAELTSFVSFISQIQVGTLKQQGINFMQGLYVQLQAFFKSGRQELLKYSPTPTHLTRLVEVISKKVGGKDWKRNPYDLALILVVQFFQSGQPEKKQKGLQIFEYIFLDSFYYKSGYSSQQLRKWIKDKRIYEIIRQDAQFCSNNIESRLFKQIKKYCTQTERIAFILTLITNHPEYQKLWKYFADYEFYYYELKQRQMILEKIKTISNFQKIPIYFFRLIQDLLCRDNPSLVQNGFNFLLNVIKQNFQFWQESSRKKSLTVLKIIYRKYLNGPFKSKSNEAANKEIKELMESLLSKTDLVSLELFVAIIIKQSGWKSISQTIFKEYLVNFVEKYNLFERIFSMAEKGNSLIKSQYNCQQQLVKFIVQKIDFNSNIFKYVTNFTKSPQIFESMLEKAKHSTIIECMKFLMQYYRENPQTPFDIFKITFQKLNESSFSSYRKVSSLLFPGEDFRKIQDNPKKLNSYEQMSELLLQTNSKQLREIISKYILDLYYNYSIRDKNGYSDYKEGEQYFIIFMGEIIQTFQKDATEYINKHENSDNGLLVNMELIKFATLFTDILGCGTYKPHKSRAVTSTIVLHVINNVTFGDDIEKSILKDFPSSMILFDALTIMGYSFKCGPEDIVLKRNGEIISPIYNSYSLEDLELSNQEIIAEKNNANPLQPPQYNKFKNLKQLPPKIINIITEIFHRFAYEGKMGIIECTNFIRQSEESECISNDRRVKDVFEFDSDDDGILTLQDFIKYYKKGLIQTYYQGDFSRRIKGFYNLRYRKNLAYFNEPTDISDQYYKMMRFLVYKNQNTYKYLFALSQDSNKQIAHKAQQLLLLLPTPVNIKQYHVKPLELADKSQFQTYYILIEAVAQLNQESMDIMEKKQKISGFLQNKNNETIFRLLEAYHLLPERTDRQKKSMLICLRILRSLINIDQLSKLDLRTFDSKQITFPSLPQTTFFRNQTIEAFKACDLINFETLLTLQLSQNAIDIKQIIQFCFDKSTQIRKIACNFLFLWAIKTKFSFNVFDISVKESDNQEWFQLLSALIQHNTNFDLQNVRINAIKQLLSLNETLYSRYNGKMNGYLKILIAFSISNHKNEGNQYQKLFDHLLYNTLSSANRNLVYNFIRNIEREYAYSYFFKRLTETPPSQECQVRQKYMGIKNLGAICYINSIIQQFFFIDKFRQLILTKNIPNDCKIIENKGQPLVDDFMYQLQRLYHYLKYSQKKYIVPNDFCFSFKNFDGLPINTTVQEDAHEFLNRLIEFSEESLKKEQKFSEFASILQIKKLNLIQCQKCRNRIEKYENDYCLSVQVKGHDTLEDSLKKFTQKQVIADYFCEKCEQKVKEISKRTYLNHLPQVLIVNLQRIVYDPMRGQKVKVHSKMSFPFEIDFKQYVKNDNPKIDSEYKLRGIVIHSGTSEAGHYYSLIKTQKDGWMKFNDQNVTSYNQNEIDRQCFGGLEIKDGFGDITYSTNAYILFYQKKNKPACQSFEIQNEFYTSIQKQNLSMINQLQVHQQSFFSAITDSYQDIRYNDIDNLMLKMPFLEEKISNKLYKEYKDLLHIGLKAFRFIGIYTGLKQDTKWKIVKMIKELFFLLPAQTIDLSYLNIRQLLQDMIVKPSISDRQMIKILLFQILSIKINFSGQIYAAQQGEMHQIIKLILSYLQSTLFYLNIIKTESYLLLLFLLMKRFEKIAILFHNHHIFFKMLQLIMGKENPFFKHHPNLVDLSVNLVPIVFDCILQLLALKTNLKGQKPMKNSYQLVTTFEAQILSNPTFFKRIQRLKYDFEAVGFIIQHFSTKDLDYSALAAEFLISNLNKKESISNIPVFFNYIMKYLSIDDEFKIIRLGFIMGIPQNKEIQLGHYCLDISDKSQYMSYISGINFKNSRLDTHFQPLVQLANQSPYRSNYFAISCLQVILRLSIESDHIFNYIMNLPPKNYYQLTYFDWIGEYLDKVSKESNVIFDKKIEKMSELININQIINQKVNLILEDRKQPVQKYIIGKTKTSEKITVIKEEEYQIRIQKLNTYVLENKPNIKSNKSMNSNFQSFNISGIGHAFVCNRSKLNYEYEAKDVQLANTLFRLVGDSKTRLRLTYNRLQNPICIYLAEGNFTLTFPYINNDDKDMDLFKIQKVKDQPQKLNQIDITHVFPHIKVVPKSETKMQQEKSNQQVFDDDSMIAQSEPKIKCGHCTYDNNITSEICEMCEQSLFA